VAPALFSSLYAYGVTHQILGGQFGIVIIAIIAGGFWVACQFLPKQVEDKPEDKKKDAEQQNEALIDGQGDSVRRTNGHARSNEAQPLLSNGHVSEEGSTAC